MATQAATRYVKCPLNYIGGKTKLLSQILPIIELAPISTFVEPFCGGLNVSANVHADRFVANDQLTYLVEMLQMFKEREFSDIRHDVVSLIQRYDLNKENKEGYDLLRSDYNQSPSPEKLFTLSCFSFNHQLRFNSAHEFNCSFGRNRSAYNASIEDNLRRFSERLHQMDVSFSATDFTELDYDVLGSSDFVYLDPPYLASTGAYNDGNRGFKDWKPEQEKALLALMEMLDDKGIRFALSNVLFNNGQENSLLEDWASGHSFTIHHLSQSYGNSSYHRKSRAASDEILLTNF